ncbi:MAG TPA: hypothetical protein VF950_13360 [Planctomycetota bacterium]
MDDQLANPFRKRSAEAEAPRRPAAPPGGTPREMVKLYVMALVFFMALGTMIYMWKAATAPKDKKGKTQGVGLLRPDGTRGDAPPQSDVPPLPPVKKDVPLQDLPKDGIVDFKKLAEPFVDGLEKPVKETPEFVSMLRAMLTSVTPDALAKRVNPKYNADLAYLNIREARGEVIKSYGRLVKIYTEPLDTTIPEKVEHVYLGIMMEYPSNRTVWFYLPEKPVDAAGQPVKFNKYTKRGEEFIEDWIELEGVALRRHDYPSQYDVEPDQAAWAKALVMFSKNVRIAAKPQMTSARSFYITIVVVGAVVIVAVVLTAGIMTRKYGGGDASMRMAVIAAKRAKDKEKAGAAAPPADVPAGAKDVPPPP